MLDYEVAKLIFQPDMCLHYLAMTLYWPILDFCARVSGSMRDGFDDSSHSLFPSNLQAISLSLIDRLRLAPLQSCTCSPDACLTLK